MAKFGKRSKEYLRRVDHRLRAIMTMAIEIVDFTIISGYRGQEEQDDLVRRGLSKKEYPFSKHNQDPSLAVDVAPYFAEWPHIRWEDDESFIFLAGVIRACAYRLQYKIRWGGDWDSDGDQHDQTFMDLGHFELEE
jgi:peptidoglycan L-alanyl-D-glutamate endopeptidase CwlK